MLSYLFKFLGSLGLLPLAKRFRIWLIHHTPWGTARQKKLRTFYSQFIRPNDLCFDVGANVGDRAEVFIELGARVVCIEPQQDCLTILRRRLGNRPQLLAVVGKAVGEQEGVAELKVCKYNSGLSSLSDLWVTSNDHAKEYDWSQTVQVPLTTLDELMRVHGVPTFCKVDVEGYEVQVLRGLTKPIPYLSLEFHGALPGLVDQSMRRITEIGTAVCNFTLNDSVEMASPEWLTPDALAQRIRGLPDKSVWGDIYVKFDVGARH